MLRLKVIHSFTECYYGDSMLNTLDMQAVQDLRGALMSSEFNLPKHTILKGKKWHFFKRRAAHGDFYRTVFESRFFKTKCMELRGVKIMSN